jgi:hypothetical protein
MAQNFFNSLFVIVQAHYSIYVYLLQACEPAASLALEDVNNRNDLLKGFTLKLHWNDSEVAIQKSTKYCVCVCVNVHNCLNFALHFLRFGVFAAVIVITEVCWM